MSPAATPQPATSTDPFLGLAFETSVSEWKIAFSTARGQRPRIRTIAARDFSRLQQEIARALEHFRLPAETRVVSCYEAGRDGFWLHRALEALGVENLIVDSSSIEVNRRQRRAKADRLDAGKLVGMLLRWLSGERDLWSVVRVPSPEEENRRQLHRELKTTRRDRGRITNRIKSLLFAQGICLPELRGLPRKLGILKLWTGEALPERLRERLEREWEKVEQLTRQISALIVERRKLLKRADDAGSECARKLFELRAIGENTAWTYSLEFFSWRRFRNGREIGALSGLVPTPHQSGSTMRELGMSKSGNRWIRSVAVEVAWAWLRYQPQSELSRWYNRRFGHGSSRIRRIGIVALARKLLIALWRYLETGLPPAGALLKA